LAHTATALIAASKRRRAGRVAPLKREGADLEFIFRPRLVSTSRQLRRAQEDPAQRVKKAQRLIRESGLRMIDRFLPPRPSFREIWRVDGVVPDPSVPMLCGKSPAGVRNAQGSQIQPPSDWLHPKPRSLNGPQGCSPRHPRCGEPRERRSRIHRYRCRYGVVLPVAGRRPMCGHGR
jgi:hypothetical protein